MARFWRNRSHRIVPLAEVARMAQRPTWGVRVTGLVQALKLGLDVPETWVLSADAFREAARSLPPGHDPASLLRVIHRSAGVERAARARERLLALDFEPAFEAELGALWEALAESAVEGVALRSSPTCGDPSIARTAGLLRTVLGIRGPEALARGIREMWTAAVQEGALSYLRARRVRDVAVAVVIQPVVPARATGLVQTDASEGARRLAYLFWKPDVNDRSRREIVALPDGGPASDGLGALCAPLAPLGPHEVEVAVTDPFDLKVLGLERCGGIGYPEGGDASTVWSRAALADVPDDPLSPLSRELAGRTAEAAIRGVLAAAGQPPPRAQHFIRFVHGRAYVNFSLFLSFLRQGSNLDAGIARDVAASEAAGPAAGVTPDDRRPLTLARAGLLAARLPGEQKRLAEQVDRFERDAEVQRRWLGEMDLAILPDDSLQTTLREGYEFLEYAGRLLATCSGVLLGCHALLEAVVARSGEASVARRVEAITAGVGDLETANPGIAFGHVLAIARHEPRARAAILDGRASDISMLPEGATLRAVRQFLEGYGDRGVNESELSAPRWREAPEALLGLLRAGLAGDPRDPDALLSRTRASADRELAVLEARLSFVEARLVRELVGRYRQLLRLRERTRVRFAQALFMLRTIVLDVDHRLRRLDPGFFPGAAFFCARRELMSALNTNRADLGPVARWRRAEYEANRGLPEPPVWFRGTPRRVASPGAPLRGRGASPGRVEGRVRRLSTALPGMGPFRPGEVVVLRVADLGFAPLFVLAGAVVAERGHPLSHGVAVLREYGVPAVVAVEGALGTLADGDRVLVDGDGGVVERLSP